ncbi:MAG: hypothetical protein WBI82_05370 [Sphaerochaeta sp.]
MPFAIGSDKREEKTFIFWCVFANVWVFDAKEPEIYKDCAGVFREKTWIQCIALIASKE